MASKAYRITPYIREVAKGEKLYSRKMTELEYVGIDDSGQVIAVNKSTKIEIVISPSNLHNVMVRRG